MISKDKLFHALAGAVVALAALIIGVPPHFAFVLSLAAGGLKELADWVSNNDAAEEGREPTHSVEFLDFVATGVGGLVVAGIWMALR